MLKKSNRTVEKYMIAGAYTRICKHFMNKLLVEGSGIVHSTESDRLWKATGVLDLFSAEAERNLCKDYRNMAGSIDVFYGGLTSDCSIRSKEDEEVRRIAERILLDFAKKINVRSAEDDKS